MKDIILTIDVGTGSSRVGLVSYKGDVIAFSQHEYDQLTPHVGWSEQQPSLWWSNTLKGARQLMTEYPEYRSRIAAISCCGQMHGTVLLDAQGELAIDRALLWNDKRNEEVVLRFIETHDTNALLSKVNNPATTAWPAFKIRWIQQNLPDVWAKTAMVLMPKDFINYKLCGEAATDYSEASCFYLMDSQTKTYSDELLALFNINKNQLPVIRNSSDIIGYVHKEAAQLTGLPEGLPVVAGCADMAATLLGSGVYLPGTGSDSTGTSTLLTVVSDKPLLDRKLNNLHLANNAWGGFSILDAGGDAMRWARVAFHNNQISYPQMIDLAKQSTVCANGLFFLPYLTGERNAEKNNSRAQFFGLTRQHRAKDIYRSILEGVAFASAINFEQLKKQTSQLNSIIASGGGAKDEFWLSIKASIYGLPIIKTKHSENGTHGCTIVGALGVGLYNDINQAVSNIVAFDKEIAPHPKHRELYLKAQDIFNKIYQHSTYIYDDLDRLNHILSENSYD